MKKIFVAVGITLIVFACIATPILSDVSYTSLAKEDSISQSSTIGRHYFSSKETELINSKIVKGDSINGNS